MTREFVLIGDVAADLFHVGDEAMFETALAEIALRCDAHVTAVALGSAGIAERYGIAAVEQLGFDQRVGSACDEIREIRLAEVLDGTATDPAAESVRAAVARADAVLVCGGGNLCSAFPHLLYERLALLELAAARGVPTVLTGQTIGPSLTARPAARLAAALRHAAFVGVRDLPSLQLVREIADGAQVLHHEDDAAQLPGGPRPDNLPATYVAFAMHGNDADDHTVERVADFAAHLRRISGLSVVLVPNTGVPTGTQLPGTDTSLMMSVQRRHPDAGWLHVLPISDPRAVATVLRYAQAVVSARFHPIVFGLSGAVPCMGLTSDHYTDIKIAGALAHHGLASWRVPMHTLGTGLAEALFDELWQRRADIGTHLATGAAERSAAHRARWDRIVACLNGGVADLASFVAPPSSAGLGPEKVNTRAALTWDKRIQHRLHQLEQHADQSEGYAMSLKNALDHEAAERNRERLAHERDIALLRAEVAASRDQLEQAQRSAADERDRERLTHERDIALLRAEMAASRDELEQAQRSAETARDLAGQLHARLDRGAKAEAEAKAKAEAAARDEADDLRRKLEEMHNMKLLRWSAPMRRLYTRIITNEKLVSLRQACMTRLNEAAYRGRHGHGPGR